MYHILSVSVYRQEHLRQRTHQQHDRLFPEKTMYQSYRRTLAEEV